MHGGGFLQKKIIRTKLNKPTKNIKLLIGSYLTTCIYDMDSPGLIPPNQSFQSPAQLEDSSLGSLNGIQTKLNSPAPTGMDISRNESSPLKSETPMDVDMDENQENEDHEEDEGPLTKLEKIELLPELYNLIHSLQNGEILAKDFDNNAGNIRLKLSVIRQTLQDIEGIEELVSEREAKIASLKSLNTRKRDFLNNFKASINSKNQQNQG